MSNSCGVTREIEREKKTKQSRAADLRVNTGRTQVAYLQCKKHTSYINEI